MPDFHLSPQEALALTAFLETTAGPSDSHAGFPREILKPDIVAAWRRFRNNSSKPSSRRWVDLPDLPHVGGHGGTRRSSWPASLPVAAGLGEAILVAPAVRHAVRHDAGAVLPCHGGWKGISGNLAAGRRPGSNRDRLSIRLGLDKREAMEEKLNAAGAYFPEAQGGVRRESIFRALNCAACHRHHAIAPRTNAAPDLSREGSRVNKAGCLLISNIRSPFVLAAIALGKAAGCRTFGLSDEEAAELSEFRLGHGRKESSGCRGASSAKLSTFSKAKARGDAPEKRSPAWAAISLGERGGRIGPDLTGCSGRDCSPTTFTA